MLHIRRRYSLCSISRNQEDAMRHQRAKVLHLLWIRCTHDCTHTRKIGSITKERDPPCFHKLRHMFVNNLISNREILQIARGWVARFYKDENSFSVPFASFDKRINAIVPEVRRDRH